MASLLTAMTHSSRRCMCLSDRDLQERLQRQVQEAADSEALWQRRLDACAADWVHRCQQLDGTWDKRLQVTARFQVLPNS
jgi:hypothetical protein